MPDIIWWLDDSWWERKSIPLGGFNLSPRQVFLLGMFGLVGYVVGALPLFSLYARVVVLLAFLLAGFVISSKQVKTVPIELQILYRYRRYGKELGKLRTKKERVQVEEKKSDQDLVVDDWSDPKPLNFSGTTPKMKRELKVSLLVDGVERMSDVVSRTKTTYKLVYVPRREDVGTRDLAVVIEGVKEPLKEMKVTVKSSGVDLLESSEKVR